jgi:hypothetical protein
MQGGNRPTFNRLPVIYLKTRKKSGGNSVLMHCNWESCVPGLKTADFRAIV